MGAARAEGRVIGVDDDARLLVEGSNGVEKVVAGEVTLRDPIAGKR
jgi:biotin-(acetyl-CoA carboxylase) ligase